MKTKPFYLFVFIALSAIFTSCETESVVGTLATSYTISGTVSEFTTVVTPIAGIKLSLINTYPVSENGTTKMKVDTVMKSSSDLAGKYMFKFNALPPNEYTVVAEDIDGANNGGEYQKKEQKIIIEAINWERKGSDVNGGKVSKTQNIEMSKK